MNTRTRVAGCCRGRSRECWSIWWSPQREAGGCGYFERGPCAKLRIGATDRAAIGKLSHGSTVIATRASLSPQRLSQWQRPECFARGICASENSQRGDARRGNWKDASPARRRIGTAQSVRTGRQSKVSSD